MGLADEILAPKDAMKYEAEQRMEALGLSKEVIKDFIDENILACSYNTHMMGVSPKILEEIKNYQAEFGNLIYHVVHSHFMGQETYECLAISPYMEDWDYEFPDEKKWTMSHSINITHPENTESGSIQLENKNGVLVRIG